MPEPSEKDKQLIEEAKKRFELCQEAEKDLRVKMLDDLNFRAGNQWPADLLRKRGAAGKVALTINVLPARERQILNDQRQNRPAIKVSPVDDKGDVETAEIIQGIIRHIEYDSSADVAYDTAVANAVRIGRGEIRLLIEYDSADSFTQTIKIERVLDPFQVYRDPSYTKADGSDAEYVFIFTELTKDEYEEQYPNSELASLDDWRGYGDKGAEWLKDDGVRLCEYFYTESEADELVRLRNPLGEERTEYASKLPKRMPKGVKVLDRRPSERKTVKWCRFNAIEILESAVWPGTKIPVIPVVGDELYLEGKRIYEGLVRHAKDPCRMQNYMASEEVQAIALAPKAPYVAAVGQTENRPEWDDANNENYSVLKYNPVTIAGSAVPPPQRNSVEPAVAAITNARLHFVDDLKAVTGIYDEQLGARSNATSGLAIGRRQMQGQLSNFHYMDNLARALKAVCLQCLELIPKVYSEAQVLRIIGEDGTHRVVQVNQQFDAGGVQKIYDLTVGKYDVTVSTGPSYQTKRQESVAVMLDLTKTYPQLTQVAGDLLVGLMDFPNHEKLAERLRKTLPPGIADDDGNDPKVALANLQAQYQQMAQQHQLLVQELAQAQQVISTKQVEQDAKVKIAELQERTKITIAEIETKAQEAKTRVEMERQQWEALHGSAHEFALQKDQQGHETDMADRNAALASQQSAQDAAQQQAQQPSAQ